jgi:hypothetical protein
VLREHRATEWIDLTLEDDRAETGPLEAKLEAADPRE